MTNEQIEMLKNALDLYNLAIKQMGDQYDENEYYHMRESLSELTGFDLIT